MTLLRNERVELSYPKDRYSRVAAWLHVTRPRPYVVEHRGWILHACDWRKSHEEHDWCYYALRLKLAACPIDAQFQEPPSTVGPYHWKTWFDHEGRYFEGYELNFWVLRGYPENWED